jgi:hypothetical protein
LHENPNWRKNQPPLETKPSTEPDPLPNEKNYTPGFKFNKKNDENEVQFSKSLEDFSFEKCSIGIVNDLVNNEDSAKLPPKEKIKVFKKWLKKVVKADTLRDGITLIKDDEHYSASTLRKEQREPLAFVYDHLEQRKVNMENGTPTEPIFHIIQGGAGTGKTHLGKCIIHETIKLFGKSLGNTNFFEGEAKGVIFVAAPTGKF